VDADQIVQKIPLDLSERIFETDLIVLSGQGIDVILGMSWMKWHKAVLDIYARLVHLNSPVYEKVTLQLPVISHIKASLHHVVERRLEDIHVVRKFPNVFPDDLPGCLLRGSSSSRMNYSPVQLLSLRSHIRCHERSWQN
jgi:hypothetical protein